MIEVQEAVKKLVKQGLSVQALHGPQGCRYQIASTRGLEYQISQDELLELQAKNKLSWSGIKRLVEDKN